MIEIRLSRQIEIVMGLFVLIAIFLAILSLHCYNIGDTILASFLVKLSPLTLLLEIPFSMIWLEAKHIENLWGLNSSKGGKRCER